MSDFITVKITAVTDSSGTYQYTGVQQQFDLATGGFTPVPSPISFSSTGPYLLEENNQQLGNFPVYVWAKYRGADLDGSLIFEFTYNTNNVTVNGYTNGSMTGSVYRRNQYNFYKCDDNRDFSKCNRR